MDSDSDNNDGVLKPTLGDVFRLNSNHNDTSYKRERKHGKRHYKNAITFTKVKVTDEFLVKIIVDNLNGPSFPCYVKYFKSNYKDCLDKSIKNAQKSVQARIKANELFAKTAHNAEIHKDIWELCSKSIAFAPVGSKELVLAYECRSNLLLHFKEYVDCVKDIDRALMLTDFALLKVKLSCRKMTCLAALNENIDEKMKLWETIGDHLKKIDVAFKDEKFLKMIEQAKNDSQSRPHKKRNMKQCSCDSTPLISHQADVDMLYNKEIRIVAHRDFAPGEKVFVTKPLATSFNPNKFFAYCGHCLSYMWAGIPCDECSLCMYCSEECKAEAWNKYHILECKMLPHISVDNINYYIMHSSTRVFLKSMREYESISKLREKMQEIDKLRDDSKLDRNLFDSDFSQFYVSVWAHVNSSNLNIVKEYLVKHACLLTVYVIKTCGIFEERNFKTLRGKELAKDQDVVNLALVILKIMVLTYENLKCPTSLYTKRSKCNKYANAVDCSNNRHCRRGTYYDTFNGLFEKSCNPNVARCWTDNGKVIYFCVQPIKKLDKITISRHYEFFLHDEDTRKRFMSFSKDCQCTACSKHWPAMEELYVKFKQRRLKEESKEVKIVQKYLTKNESPWDFVQDENCEFNPEEYQQLLRDVNDVVKVCGQPSFASSMMIGYLCKAFEKRHGCTAMMSRVPQSC